MVQGGVPAAAPAGGAAGGSTSGGKQASELATASQTITGLATGTHVYTVKGYSLLLGRGVGESVSSEQFQAGGHSWVVQFYPDGYNNEVNNSEYVALSLTLASEATNLWALYTFTMIDQSGRGEDRSMGRSVQRGPCKFESMNFRRGKPRFIKRADLQNSGLLMNDTVVIKCEVSVVVTETITPVEEPTVKVPPPRLGTDLGQLLTNDEDCDVTFTVGEQHEPIRAHKLILAARSEVFGAMFRRSGDSPEPLTDVEPEVFCALLHFVYTGDLRPGDDTPDMAQHLLAGADFFRLDRLRLMCERRLCEKVDTKHVASTLMLADRHSAQELKKVCLEFSASHLQEVMASDGWKYLIECSKTLHLEVLEAAAKKIESDKREGEDGRGTKRKRQH